MLNDAIRKLLDEIIEDIEDVEPVRHGYWIEDNPHCDGLCSKWICSECGEDGGDEYFNYCPNCGAKMDYNEWLASKDR